MKDLLGIVIGFILVIAGVGVTLCVFVFNIVLMTLPIWGGALILMAIFS